MLFFLPFLFYHLELELFPFEISLFFFFLSRREPPPVGVYADFLRDTFSVFTVGLDRELYLQEERLPVNITLFL